MSNYLCSYSFLRNLTQRYTGKNAKGHIYKNIHSSLISNSRSLETTQLFKKERTWLNCGTSKTSILCSCTEEGRWFSILIHGNLLNILLCGKARHKTVSIVKKLGKYQYIYYGHICYNFKNITEKHKAKINKINNSFGERTESRGKGSRDSSVKILCFIILALESCKYFMQL